MRSSHLNDSKDENDVTTSGEPGNGFLMRNGYILLETGWDVTAPNNGKLFTATAPIAKNPDGSPITGPSTDEFVIDKSATPAQQRLSYPAASTDKSKATLTVRRNYADAPVAAAIGRTGTTPTSGSPRSSSRRAISAGPARSDRRRSTSSPMSPRIRWWSGSASPRCATSRRSCATPRPTTRAGPIRSPATCSTSIRSAPRSPAAPCTTSCSSASINRNAPPATSRSRSTAC